MGKHRLICILLILLLFGAGGAWAQVSSAAFDPNCYFPRIGVPGEIDTIYGSHHLQYLGSPMLNIGSSAGESYGRMYCGFDYNDTLNIGMDSLFSTGPDFNLHKLHILGDFKTNQILQWGHFRSPKYKDILWKVGYPWRIYWQDDNGNYDTSRYTNLNSKMKGKLGVDYLSMSPYAAHISSDSFEDVICSVMIRNENTPQDSVYILYFKGGQQLYDQGKDVFEDSSIFFGKAEYVQDAIGGYNLGDTRSNLNQGDFRGVGREDLILANDSGDFTYFKNDPPFSMSSFVHALKYDTLFAHWQNRQTKNWGGGMAMHVYNKPKEDSSLDFLPFFKTKYGTKTISEYRIFKGGKDFGANRWTLDSASFVIHEPYYYDDQFGNGMVWGVGINDCGDMTGTGNRVLRIGAYLDAGFYGYEFFYVLGDALDDKVDMFIGAVPNNGGAGYNVDTLVADHDQLQDILMGMPAYHGDDDPEPQLGAEGTIYLLHGSTKIPVRVNKVLSNNSQQGNISMFPNPVTGRNATLDLSSLEQQDLQICIYDLLGRKVYSQQVYLPYMRQKHQIYLNSLSNGSYILEVAGKNFTQRIQFSILK